MKRNEGFILLESLVSLCLIVASGSIFASTYGHCQQQLLKKQELANQWAAMSQASQVSQTNNISEFTINDTVYQVRKQKNQYRIDKSNCYVQIN